MRPDYDIAWQMTDAPDASVTVSGDTTGMSHLVVPGEIDTSHGLILYLENISVSFDGFRALNDLSLSIKTVSTYRTRIMEKMGLQSNSDLTYYAMKNNLLD